MLLTVEELIAKLRTLPQDAEIYFRPEGAEEWNIIHDATYNARVTFDDLGDPYGEKVRLK